MATRGRGNWPFRSSWAIWQTSALKWGTGRKTVFGADRDTADQAIWEDWFFEAGGLTHYTITAEKGTFTETGIAATLTATRTITAANATFVEAGQDASLRLGRKVAAAVGTFVETGQNATLIAVRTLPAAVGAFTETGIAASLEMGRKVGASVGEYVLTGQDVTLTYEEDEGLSLAVDAGTFELGGQDTAFIRTFYLTAEAAEYAYEGQDVSFLHNRVLEAGVGQFAAAMQTGTTQYHLQRQRQMFSLDGR